MTAENVKTEVRCKVRESQNVLQRSKDSKELIEAMNNIHQLMLGKAPDGIHMKEEFYRSHYSRWLNVVVGSFSSDWLVMDSNPAVMIDLFFLEGEAPDQAFLVLTDSINMLGKGYLLNKIVSITEAFMRRGHMMRVMLRCCEESSHGVTYIPDYSQLVTRISALPDTVISKLKLETSELFFPPQYVQFVGEELSLCMEHIHMEQNEGQMIDLAFLGLLIGKLCMTGQADILWPVVLSKLSAGLYEDVTWCRLWEGLMSQVPERAIESVLVGLLQHAPWYGTVARILGNNIVSSHKVQFLLTNKLLFLRYFKEVVVTVLDVWSNGSAVRHTSYDQHAYITKAILVCLAMMQHKDKEDMKEKLLSSMMPGVQVHLDSPLPRVRRLGMIVAEALSTTLDPSGPKLKFEYDEDEESDEMFSLLKAPEPPDFEAIAKPPENPGSAKTSKDFVKPGKIENRKIQAAKDVGKTKVAYSDESDNDLEPYDLSNDVKVTKIKKPKYLRDCMEGLLDSGAPERLEICLQSSASVIRKHPHSVAEIAAEFTKILVHLQDSCAISGFLTYRHQAMVALLVAAPKPVAEYLTAEFYGPNFNVRQRLDMLEALVAGAQELSSPADACLSKPLQPDSNADSRTLPTGEQDWREIIERRIASKTRRFAHGTKLPSQAKENCLSPVAGYFFFPLLAKFDQKEQTLDLLGEDHIVLQRLLFSLGAILHAATNAPAASQMGAALLRFVWALRYHPQPSVTRGLLFSVCMLLLSVPSHFLLSDLHEDLIEMKLWLKDIVEESTDRECQSLAMQGLLLMEQAVKKEFETPLRS